MTESIPVSDETKTILERLKRDDETFDELLRRLVATEEPIDIGVWDSETADQARAAVSRSREDFGDWRETAVDPRTVDDETDDS